MDPHLEERPATQGPAADPDVVRVPDELRAAIAARDQLLGEKSDEIRWLRGEVSKMIGKLTPIAIAETSGAGLKGPVGPVPAPEDDEYGGVGPK